MPDSLVHGPHLLQASTGDSELKPSLLDPASLKRRAAIDLGHGPFQLSRFIRYATNKVLTLRDGLSESEREDKRRIEERMQILAARMANAGTVQEWEKAAKELDRLEGNDQWKLDDSSGDYNAELISARLAELDEARANLDTDAMIYAIRTALSRDLGGMGNMDLYRHSYVGTKRLVERYIQSVLETIQLLVDKSTYHAGLEPRDLLDSMVYARQSFGRSALLLSGGATFGMSHIGVLKTLFEAKLLPRIISGASAGSIVCSVLCTRRDSEIPSVIEAFPYGDLGVFAGRNETFSSQLYNLLTKGNWFDISNLTRVMRNWLGDMTFQEAYNRTRRVCNICVSSASIYELPRLLNYITAPDVMIWSAVAASCSVPLVFEGVPLMAKDPVTGEQMPWNPTPRRYIDGSVDNDLPMTRLSDLFNVNHFIVSQVNPHIVPFLTKDDRLYPATNPGKLRQKRESQDRAEWFYTATDLAKEETLHRMQCFVDMGIFPNLLTKIRSVLSQKYSGDITIFPEISIADATRILANPTSEFMIRNCLTGERATWPKLSRIRDRLAIELALDQAVHDLRARAVFSRSQEDLRRSTHAPSHWMTGFTMGSAEWVVQPQSGDATPEERTLGRRRGSGATIQLLASRHRKAFQDVGDEESDEDEGFLEMKIRPSTKVVRPSRSGVWKPRLKRSSRSHSQLQRGRPLGQNLLDELKLPSYDYLKPSTLVKNSSKVSFENRGSEKVGKASALPLSPTGIEILVGPMLETGAAETQTSDGGQESDPDPYARRDDGGSSNGGEWSDLCSLTP